MFASGQWRDRTLFKTGGVNETQEWKGRASGQSRCQVAAARPIPTPRGAGQEKIRPKGTQLLLEHHVRGFFSVRE